jgi:hypothetical protein
LRHSLDGPGAQILDNTTFADALGPNLTTITATGHLTLLDGAAFSTAGNFEDDGTLSVGAGCTFTVNGNFTMGNSATLGIQVGGTGAGQSGIVAVTGVANLAGTLQVTLVNGYVPTSGDSIKIMTFTPKTGTFGALTGDGPLFTPMYDSTDVTLVAN